MNITIFNITTTKKLLYMTGKELKAKLIGCGVSQSEIARRLEISQQSFNQSMLVNDVKSGLLERIAKAIDVPMSFFYPNEGQKAVVNGDNSVAAIQSTVTQGDCAVLRERVKSLEALLAEKERLISVLMEVRK